MPAAVVLYKAVDDRLQFIVRPNQTGPWGGGRAERRAKGYRSLLMHAGRGYRRCRVLFALRRQYRCCLLCVRFQVASRW